MPTSAENEHYKFVVNTAVEEVQCTFSVASSIRRCVCQQGRYLQFYMSVRYYWMEIYIRKYVAE